MEGLCSEWRLHPDLLFRVFLRTRYYGYGVRADCLSCDRPARSAAVSILSIVHRAWPLLGREESKPKGVMTIATMMKHLHFDSRQVGHWCKWRLQGVTGTSPCQAGSCPHSVPGLSPRGSAGVSTHICFPLTLKPGSRPA